MPMDYLRKIEKADFPLRVEDFRDINNVAVLEAAGLVDVDLERVPSDATVRREVAVVLRITPLGRAMLERLVDCDPLAYLEKMQPADAAGDPGNPLSMLDRLRVVRPNL